MFIFHYGTDFQIILHQCNPKLFSCILVLIKYLQEIYIYACSRRVYPKRLTEHSGYTFIVSVYVSWELNPRPLRC